MKFDNEIMTSFLCVINVIFHRSPWNECFIIIYWNVKSKLCYKCIVFMSHILHWHFTNFAMLEINYIFYDQWQTTLYIKDIT